MDIEKKRVEKLITAFLATTKEHYECGPVSRARVYEVLNALAIVTAVTLYGADEEALDFFRTALHAHLESDWIQAVKGSDN